MNEISITDRTLTTIEIVRNSNHKIASGFMDRVDDFVYLSYSAVVLISLKDHRWRYTCKKLHLCHLLMLKFAELFYENMNLVENMNSNLSYIYARNKRPS